MAIQAKNKARFAMEGFRVRRLNPDGTIPGASRLVGFVGTADLSKVPGAMGSTFPAQIKVDTGPWQAITLDFSAVTDLKAVDVAEAVDVLTADVPISGLTWQKETATDRLIGVSSTLKDVQIKGAIFGALDFGNGIKVPCMGSYWKSYFNDEAISCSFPNDMVDKEEIDLEGAKGTITRMIVPAKRLGSSPVLAMKFKDDELLQLMTGGDWIPPTNTEPGIYEPPASDKTDVPSFVFEAFAPLYADGSSKMSEIIGMERKIFRNCSATEGDVPMEAKSWAQYGYNITAVDYIDEKGDKFPCERREEYDINQFAALQIDKY